MKNFYILFLFCMMGLFMASCGDSSQDEPVVPEPEGPSYITGVGAIVAPTGTFAKDDGALALDENSARSVAKLLDKAGSGIVKGMGNVKITDKQYQEIKDFTDELVGEAKTPADAYQKIFQWITGNIKYASGYVDNDPYPVFQSHQAICQGYANLLTVMLHTQGIPAFNANGMLNPVGGHAWNYVWLDEWYVSDPTNNGHFRMSAMDSYKHLDPMSLDVNLFEDENFVFDFYERHLNLKIVKKSGKQFVVPFSTNGFQVSSFNPDAMLPEVVEEIYIGKNIKTLGENVIKLEMYAPSVKYAYVDEDSKWMDSYGQVVYRNNIPYYIPNAATVIQFKGIATFEKNFVKNRPKLETIVVSSGTKTLEAYAFEDCPNLRKAYIPQETKVDKNAFYGVHTNFEVIRGIVKD